MTRRENLIIKLLETFHLNVLERKLFQENPIKLSEIQNIIEIELSNQSIFPKLAIKEGNHLPNFEGYFIEKISKNEYILCWQRNNPINPIQLSEQKKIQFHNIKNIVREYIDKEFKFMIDGIIITQY